MRKLKLLIAMSALLFGSVASWAQTDVTSVYLTNPSFELGTAGTPAASAASNCYDAPYGWTTDGIAGGTRNFGIFNAQGGTPSAFGTQVTPANGDYYYLARNSWGDHIVVTYSQTPTLPAGIYSLDVAYKIATRDANSKGTLQLKAIQGETETKVVSPVSANESSDKFFNTAGWTRLSVPFTVAESGEVTLQIYMDFNPGGGNPQQEAILIDDVRLYNLSNATEADPADVTGWLVNHSFELDTYTGSKADGSTASSGSLNYPTGWSFMLKTEGWNNCVNITDAPSDGNLARETWAGTINELKIFQTLKNLPAGVYEISADARTNDGGANDICTYGTVAGSTAYSTPWDQSKMAGTWNGIENWQTLTARFALDEAGDAEVGLHSTHFMQFDNFRLAYLGADKMVSDAEAEVLLATIPTGKMSAEAQSNLNTAKTNFENKKTETNYNTLSNAIEAANASIAAYAAASSAIDAANALKEAHNYASASAITTFADAILSAQTAYNNGTLSTSDANELGKSLGVGITGWRAAANSAAVKYMNDGFALNAFDAALYINTWSNEGEGDGSNFKVPFYEYFAGDGSALSANTWTGTVAGLENGLYEVTAWVRVRTQNAETTVDELKGISMNVNGGTSVDVTEGDQVGTSRFQLKEYTAEGLVKDGKLHLNIIIDAENNIHWLSFKNIKYTKKRDLNPDEMTATDEEIAALIATIPTDKMSDARLNAINTAKEALLSTKSMTDYEALETAIEAAAASIASYALIASGTISTDNATGWAISTSTGSLACNTWSTEGNSDGSGMTTNFIQDWASAGNALGEGALYYEINELNPGEYYKVTALVRAYNEAGGAIDGASFFVNDGNKSLDEVGVACTGRNGKYGNFSVVGQVDENGKLRFGLQLVSTSAINWVAIKNVTIETATGKVPTAIALAEHNTTMVLGSEMTLTATITPEDADDKLVIWSSDNEEVATVANGVVKALNVGTATITATAYAGDNVKITTTITVTEAPAPAFYSTEFADGDYYIMNAATGLFLGGANDWGTHASVIEHGIPFGMAKVSDGVYTLDSYTYNNGNDHYVGGTYIDAGKTNLYIQSAGNGKFNISTADGSKYISAFSGSTYVDQTGTDANSSWAQWYFISKKDHDKALAAATAENPVDATYYVKQANPSRNLSAGAYNVNAWSQYNVGGTQDNTNFAAQIYNAVVDNYQIIENIPNGTYIVSVQAFTSGADVKFYANDQKVDVKNNDSGASTCSAAAALFAKNLYPNTVTVTVTDRTLKIGFEGDCSSNKWLCYDKVEMFMTGYTANTGVTAEINKAEIEAGQTAQITAATVPAAASFNAITYASEDNAIATVDENGVVTGVGIGETNIVVTASEMENFSQKVAIKVTAVTPTALAFEENEIALDIDKQTATLTINPTPDNANTSVTWTSSDETVATVADGVVTGVSTGTATITATSTLDENVKATVTVTVAYPETEAAQRYFVNENATRTVYTPGENIIKNGSFEYPDGYYGWTDATAEAAKLSATNFDIVTDGGNKYIRSKNHGGSSSANSIGTAWAIEAGKTYVFSYKTKAVNAGSTEYQVVSLTNTLASETSKISTTQTVGTDWTEIKYTFTNSENYAYLQFRARWLGEKGQLSSFDDFYLAEVAASTEGNVDYATAAIPTANIGDGAFQYSQDAINAANALIQGEATVEDVQNAYNALTTVNEPEANQLFNVILTYNGWTYDQKAMTYLAGDRADMGGYNIKYQAEANQNLAQAFTFTKVSGNDYKMSQIDADGNVRYISTGVPYSGNTAQIRTTTDADKALVVTVIPTATEGVWNLKNTEANQYIGSQDAGVYTVNSHIDFNIVETTKPVITFNTTDAGYGTVMLPFAKALPEGVKAYTCSAVKVDDESVLELVEADDATIEANKPYIIQGAWDAELTGDAQGIALSYTDGWLTGVYAQTDAPNNSYVLQNHEGTVGFYRVNKEVVTPQVGANRAYLTVPVAAGSRPAFFFGEDETTGINAIQALTSGEAEIYNAAGARIPTLQKGMNIVIRNGKSYKMIVK